MKQVIVEKKDGKVFKIIVDDSGWITVFKWLEKDDSIENYSVDNL